MLFNRDVLPNRLRIVTETVPHVQSVSVGIWIGTGSRDEDDSNSGISHFIEHMLFKGTEKRTAQQIADEFDSIGGHLNAFTEKEYTCYYAKVLCEHLPIAVDVLGDMLLNSIFDPEEMEREKNVVLEEIKRYEDSPDDLIHDVFARTIWNGHPLGNSVLGNRETVAGLTRDSIIAHLRKYATPENIVVAAAGNLGHSNFVELIGKQFGSLNGTSAPTNQVPPDFRAKSNMTSRPTEQVHFCVGTRGYSQLDENKYTLALIDTALGGGMSSRLFQEIREKRGLVYAIGSYSIGYRESGLFAAYGGTSIENLELVIDLVRGQFENVRKSGLTEKEITRAKNQIRGALVLGQENMTARMIRLGKSELYVRRVVPVDEIIEKVKNVTQDDINRVAEEIFDESTISVAAIGPFDDQKVVMTNE